MKFTLLFLSVLLACGGGGGTSSSGTNSGGSKGVRILHGLLDQPVLDLIVDGSIVQSSKYGKSHGFFSAGSGSKQFSIAIKNIPTDIIASTTASVDGNSKTSILLYGNSLGIGIKTAVISEGSPINGASFRVVHAVNSLGNITAEIDGIITNSTSYGSASDYVASAPGLHKLILKVNGNQIYNSDINLTDSGNTILVSGVDGYFMNVTNYPS